MGFLDKSKYIKSSPAILFNSQVFYVLLIKIYLQLYYIFFIFFIFAIIHIGYANIALTKLSAEIWKCRGTVQRAVRQH